VLFFEDVPDSVLSSLLFFSFSQYADHRKRRINLIKKFCCLLLSCACLQIHFYHSLETFSSLPIIINLGLRIYMHQYDLFLFYLNWIVKRKLSYFYDRHLCALMNCDKRDLTNRWLEPDDGATYHVNE